MFVFHHFIKFCIIYHVRGHWQPIQQQGGEVNDCSDYNSAFFVKVYMEGIPIGRKLNLLAHNGYHELVNTLEQMFDTTILCNYHSPSYMHF